MPHETCSHTGGHADKLHLQNNQFVCAPGPAFLAGRRVISQFSLRCNRVLQSVCNQAAISLCFDYYLPPCPLQFVLFVVLSPGRGNHLFSCQARLSGPFVTEPLFSVVYSFPIRRINLLFAGRDVVFPACLMKSQYTECIFRTDQPTNIAVRCAVSKKIKL